MTKLYDLVRNVAVPCYYRVDRATGEVFSQQRRLPACVMVRWPDGRPCIYVEMYLASRAGRLTVRADDGGSLRAIGSELTHLVRYCAREQREFGELVHDDIRALRSGLLASGRANNTTINRIINRSIDFLKWFQTYIACDTQLVGVPSGSVQPQIRLKKAKYKSAHGYAAEIEIFDSPLTTATPDPDGPISLAEIRKLWDAVEGLFQVGTVSKKFQNRFSNAEQRAHLEYVRARRLVLLDVMEAIGCRPGELAFETTFNLAMLRSGRLDIPTLKRGESGHDPLRRVPVSAALRIRLELFATHRAMLIRRLKKNGIEADDKDALLLNADNGGPMSRDALRKEFRRLRVRAGIEEKLCLRMFRHRFVTNMVKLHLIEYVSRTESATYASLLRRDVRTILTRVMRFTGHRNPDSLLPYIHIALDELGVFRDINNEVNRVEIIRAALRSLHTITSDLHVLAESEAKMTIVTYISEQLVKLSTQLDAALVT